MPNALATRIRAASLIAGTVVVITSCGVDVVGTEIAATTPVTPSVDAGSTTDAKPEPDPIPVVPSDPDSGASPCNTVSDPLNCGSCGHSCLGGACSNGVCAPTTVASGLSHPHGLALDATSAYVADNATGRISKVPLAGGPTQLVFDSGQAPRALALESGRLYWVEQSKVRSVETDGQNERSQNIAGGGSAVLVVGGRVYVNQLDNGGNKGKVSSRDLNLDNDQVVEDNLESPVGIALSSTQVYWTSAIAGGSIGRAPRGSTQIGTTVVSGETKPSTIAFDGTRIFWTTDNAIRFASLDDALPTLAPKTLVEGEVSPTSLYRSGSDLYWLANGELRKLGVSTGGKPVTLARDAPQDLLPLTTAIAADDTYVYWLASNGGTLSRVPR